MTIVGTQAVLDDYWETQEVLGYYRGTQALLGDYRGDPGTFRLL